MLSFVGTMLSGPALVLIVFFLLKLDLNKLLARHPWEASLGFAGYGAFIAVMFFTLQDVFLVFKPAPGIPPLSHAELVDRLETAFRGLLEGEGKPLFDLVKTGDKVIITWSSAINYFQVSNAGGKGMKRVIVLTFAENNHDVFFVMKDKDWDWNTAQNSAQFSLNYSVGITAEFQTEVRPSISFARDGGIKVDLKKLTYSSDDLWLPIQETVLSAGWTLRGGMAPKFAHRVLFALPIALLFFAMAYFVTGVAGVSASRRTATGENAGAIASMRPIPSGIVGDLPLTAAHMPTPNIQSILEGIMRAPKQYWTAGIRQGFVGYANAYFLKTDQNREFAAQLLRFARENAIEGLKQSTMDP